MTRVIVVGTGFVAVHRHLPAWSKLAGSTKIVALCDADLVRAGDAAKRFGVPRVYDNIAEALERERPDIVDICVPPAGHATMAIQAMETGSHVLVEKPMAATVEECDAILRTAEQTGRKVCVAHSDLYYPVFAQAREEVRRGAIGQFTGMQIFLATPVDYMTSRPHHWAHRLAGGVLGETGPHAVYLTLAFINPILRAQATAQKLFADYPWSTAEDYRLTLTGERNVSTAILTYGTNQWAARVDLWGTDGLLRVDLESQCLVRYNRKSLDPQSVGISVLSETIQVLAGLAAASVRRLTGRLQTAHEILISRFLESIKDGSEPPVSPQEGREAVRVMSLLTNQVKSWNPGSL